MSRATHVHPADPDRFFCVFILVFASLHMAGWVESSSIPHFLIRATWWLLYVVAVIRLVMRFGIEWVYWLLRRQALLGVLMALAMLSTLWSLAPRESLHMSLSLMATTLLGVYMGFALPPPAMARCLAIAFALVILPSLAALPVLPDTIVVEPTTGQWRGLMDHKNSFGALAAVAVLFYAAPLARRQPPDPWRIVMLTACVLAVVLSRSVASLIACLVGVAVLVWPVLAPGWGAASRRVRIGLLLGCALAFAVAVFNLDPITRALGRDATFNRRTLLWSASLRIIRERPLTGYGYHVVWWKHENTLLPHIPETAWDAAASAHNALLNTATEMGLPAAALLAAYLVITLLDAIRFEQRYRSALSLFVLATMLTMATLNIVETYVLGIHLVLWMLFVAIAVMLRRSFDNEPASASGGSMR